MLRRALISALAISVAGSLAPVAPATAKPDRTPSRPAAVRAGHVELTGYADLVVDDASGRVFVAQGSTQLVVASSALTRARTITLPTRARAMVLDGDTLYVAGNGEADVVAVDTATLEVRDVASSVSACAQDVALAAGTLWVASDCEATPGLTAVDPATGATTEVSSRRLAHVTRAPAGRLVVAGIKGDPALELLEIGDGPAPAVTTIATHARPFGEVVDMAVVPGEERIWVALANHDVGWYDLGTLDDLDYRSAYGTPSVASRADGLVAVAGGRAVSFYEPDGRWYGDVTAARAGEIFPAGLAFGGVHAYVAVDPPRAARAPYLVRVRAGRESRIVKGPFRSRSVDAGTDIRFSGRLVADSSSREVLVYRRTRTSQDQLLRTLTVGPDGRFSGTVRATQTMQIHVVFKGDADTLPSSATYGRISVDPRVRSGLRGEVRVERGVAVYRSDARVVLAGTVRPAAPGACVKVILWVRREGRWRIAGDVCARQSGPGRFRVIFPGDASYVGRTWSLQATVRANAYYNDGEDDRKVFRFIK
ncbi:hypothetical protein HNR19_000912 [Nocardioides thalensis]|uniref:Uncharacterized protein n=1 Tax=Nocardioides thalensis TaxID=1914755 RepID=A0A853BYT9_9ACTN|nr:hypothetical protein [Nocardioides thalensis]NYJ00214.1 hypothetical protein [Nocardioides thalensis]